MSISNVNLLSSLGNNSLTAAKAPVTGSTTSFQDVLSSLMQDTEQTQAVSATQSNQLLSGEVNNLHEITIASTEAELQLNLAIQVRNKVVDAYNEIMRMQV